MGGHLELGRATDRLDRLLQRAIGEGGEAAALLTDQMMVVQLGIDTLVARRIAADLDSLDQVQPLELIEGPVDARPADRLEPPVNLQRRKRTGLSGKQPNHLTPRRTAAVTGLVKAPHRCLGPAHGRERIR